MSTGFKKVSVLGLGYIGLPTAAMFASKRIEVAGVDTDTRVVDTINKGKIHIAEPELDVVVHAAVAAGYLRAALVPEPADAFLIAVPTPFRDDREPDLTHIEAASRSLAKVLKKGDLVVLESTAPVGATEQMAAWLAKERPDLSFPQQSENPDINIAHCPERVLPGHVVRELVENDRVIGGMSIGCSKRAVELYKTFVQGECLATNARTAEMAKLTENSFRDVNIAFANELSIICDKQGINVWELIELANRHPRVNVLQPGPGVGGHCIAVDPWFIISGNQEDARLIRQARETNELKPEWVKNKIEKVVAEFLFANPGRSEKDIVIACFGIAFKPNIDDLRGSPSLYIANDLASLHEREILVVEPNIEFLPSGVSEGLLLVSQQEAILRADVCVILVGHKEFEEIDIKLSDKMVIDVAGIVR